MELLLSTVPRFSTTLVQAYPTSDPDTIIIEAFGGGQTATSAYTQRYFSLITTVGTPQAVTAEELRLESMVPADDATERNHADFVARHASALGAEQA